MIATFLFLLVSATSVAAAGDDPVLDGITAEVERAKALRLPGAEPPHHILVYAIDGWELDSRAMYGQLVWSRVRPLDTLKVEVRAGTAEFDSTGLGEYTGSHGIDTSGLPDVPSERAIRERVWADLDEQYKLAVENLGTKRGAREAFETEDAAMADWQVIDDPVVSVQREDAPEPDLASAEALVTELSGELRASGFEHVEVELSERVGHRVIVASDGTRVVSPFRWVWLGFEIIARAEDNETHTFNDFVVVRTRDALPERDVLSQKLATLAAQARTWAAAPRLESPWYGPVILEGDAAAEHMRRTMGRLLTGTPPVAQWRPWRQDVEPASPSAARPGTRLLPLGWSVVDDVTVVEESRCCMAIDNEGVRARRVSLIEDGAVVGHLMTRTPNRWFNESTGHARGGSRYERAFARVNNLIITPPGSVSRARLYKLAMKEARKQGVDRILVVRDAGVSVWRYRDGREDPVRGFDMKEADPRALRGMTVAGPMESRQVHHGRARVTTPDLLLQNQAITPSTATPESPLRRSSPLISDRAAL